MLGLGGGRRGLPTRVLPILSDRFTGLSQDTVEREDLLSDANVWKSLAQKPVRSPHSWAAVPCGVPLRSGSEYRVCTLKGAAAGPFLER